MNGSNRGIAHCNSVIQLIILIIITTGMAGVLNAQPSYNVITGGTNTISWLKYGDAGNSLYRHLSSEAMVFIDQRSEEIKGISSLSDWQQRQGNIKQTLMEIVGPFPDKTPLNTKITRTLEKDDYRVEHIVFESQPGFYVTSSLFIPAKLNDSPAPAILYVSGHYHEAYRVHDYQHVILNLVKKGFIVFAIDPVGQGERLEYYDEETGESAAGRTTGQHEYTGAQAFITGSSQARYMTWDGIRAVDYLLSRDEVDPERIGIHGMSGGGTQTAYIAAMDDRIFAAATSNYVVGFRRLLESIGPQDMEQNFYHGIARGIDHGDLLAVRAPKPVLIMSTTNDFFSIQGARETYEEVEHIYEAYGEEDQIDMVYDVDVHTVTRKNREAMYAFFQKHLNNPGNSVDLEVNYLSDDEIRVTSTGQVATSLGGESVFSLNRKESERRIEELREARNDLDGHLDQVRESAKRLSGYREPETVSRPVFAGVFPRYGYSVEKYFVKGEGDYVIPYLVMVPEQPNGNALLYIHPEGKEAEADTGREMEWFARKGFTVLAPDLIGTGELSPDRSLRREWRTSVLIGRSITGIQAGDVVRLARLLENHEAVSGEIYGFARGEMSPVMLHAAAFESKITRVALIEPYSSYSSIVLNEYYNTDFIDGSVPGALTEYDLPDLAAGLAPAKLLMAGITYGSGSPKDQERMKEELSIIREAYNETGNRELLTLDPVHPNEDLFNYLGKWIH